MANISNPGLSTLKVRLGYGVETTAGTKPAAFTWLQRVNSIGGVSLSTEQIDVSAIEDDVTKYTAGRQDTGGEWTVCDGSVFCRCTGNPYDGEFGEHPKTCHS